MTTKRIFGFISFLFFIVSTSLYSQTIDAGIAIGDSTQTHILKTKKGDIFIGQTLSIQNLDISFLFNNKDTLRFKLGELSSLEVYDPSAIAKEKDEELEAQIEEYLSPEIPIEPISVSGTERIYLMPTAFGLKKKQWEYRNTMVLFNSIDYGISDHITIGADLLPMIVTNIVGLKIKGSFDINKKIHLGGGARVHYYSDEFDDSGTLTSFFGSATFGNREKFINFSYGMLSVDDEFSSEDAGYFSIGGSLRVSEQWKLMADSFFSTIDEEDFPTFVFLGAAYFGEKHRLDFGLTMLTGFEGFFVPIPTVGYGVRF